MLISSGAVAGVGACTGLAVGVAAVVVVVSAVAVAVDGEAVAVDAVAIWLPPIPIMTTFNGHPLEN